MNFLLPLLVVLGIITHFVFVQSIVFSISVLILLLLFANTEKNTSALFLLTIFIWILNSLYLYELGPNWNIIAIFITCAVVNISVIWFLLAKQSIKDRINYIDILTSIQSVFMPRQDLVDSKNSLRLIQGFRILATSLLHTIIVLEFLIILLFWPINLYAKSLLIITAFLMTFGYNISRSFKAETTRAIVGLVVIGVTILTTSWVVY